MTLVLKFDLDIIIIWTDRQIDRQTDRQTDSTEIITYRKRG